MRCLICLNVYACIQTTPPSRVGSEPRGFRLSGPSGPGRWRHLRTPPAAGAKELRVAVLGRGPKLMAFVPLSFRSFLVPGGKDAGHLNMKSASRGSGEIQVRLKFTELAVDAKFVGGLTYFLLTNPRLSGRMLWCQRRLLRNLTFTCGEVAGSSPGSESSSLSGFIPTTLCKRMRELPPFNTRCNTPLGGMFFLRPR